MLHGYDAKRVVVTREGGAPAVSLGGVLDANKVPKHVVRLVPSGVEWQGQRTTAIRVELRRRSIKIELAAEPALVFLVAPPTEVERRNNALTELYLSFKISDKRYAELEAALREIFAGDDRLVVNEALAF